MLFPHVANVLEKEHDHAVFLDSDGLIMLGKGCSPYPASRLSLSWSILIVAEVFIGAVQCAGSALRI
jgi:hypothetical protein